MMTETRTNKDDRIEITTEQARGGVTGTGLRHVLAGSLLLAVLTGIGFTLYY